MKKDASGIDWKVKRVSLSWHRWNEYKSLIPRKEVGLHWTAVQWAWFQLEIER